MKISNKLIYILLSLLVGLSLFVWVVNDHQLLKNITALIIGFMMGVILLIYIIKYDSIIGMIQDELQLENHKINNPTYKSIIISLLIIFYTFIVIGSTVASTSEILNAISISIRMMAIVIGFYFLYVNYYLIRQKNKNITFFLKCTAIILFILSTAYHLLVSSTMIIDLF